MLTVHTKDEIITFSLLRAQSCKAT